MARPGKAGYPLISKYNLTYCFHHRYFAQPEVLNRVPYLFVLLGGVCCALCSVGALLSFKPPRNVTDEVAKLEIKPS